MAERSLGGLGVRRGPGTIQSQHAGVIQGRPQAAARVACGRSLLVVAFSLCAAQVHGQSFYYVEPGLASCPAAPAPSAAAPQKVTKGAAVPGRISVKCGFDQGSYTVSLRSSDPGAAFSPKTFVVNFGQIVGNGAFAVRFSTLGIQSVSATITSNMGSPAVRGQFLSPGNEFDVVMP